MRLAEQGRPLLPDPVGRCRSSFHRQRMAMAAGGNPRLEPARRDATVHDLLRHAAGLGYGQGDAAPGRARRDSAIDDRRQTDAEMARALVELPPLSQPRGAWQCSRATDVPDALLEAAAREPLDALLRRLAAAAVGHGRHRLFGAAGGARRLAKPFARHPQTGARRASRPGRARPGSIPGAASEARCPSLIPRRTGSRS